MHPSKSRRACGRTPPLRVLQIFNCAREAIPGLEEQIAAGDFKPLKVNAHSAGGRVTETVCRVRHQIERIRGRVMP